MESSILSLVLAIWQRLLLFTLSAWSTCGNDHADTCRHHHNCPHLFTAPHCLALPRHPRDHNVTRSRWLDLPHCLVSVDVQVPYYNLHKILQGLLDMHELLGNAEAMQILLNMVDYFYKRIMAIVTNNGTATWNAVLGTEAGGMNDIMYQHTMSPY